MLIMAEDQFSFEKIGNGCFQPKVQEWEKLMWSFQQALPGAAPGEKWMPMERIFSLRS
jgi:L-rhamnose mutarotase